MTDLQVLAADAMQGRKTGTDGAQFARGYIVKRFRDLGLLPLHNDYAKPFFYSGRKQGVNLLGRLPACDASAPVVFVTAHYDHLGIIAGKIYNGADDNASGVAMMLNLAAWLSQQCRAYHYWFVATDAEESGLYGAKALLAEQSWKPQPLALLLNLDMLSRYEGKQVLYWYGSKGFVGLNDWLEQHAMPLTVRWRRTERSRYLSHRVDWATASDHAPFLKSGYPVLYFATAMHGQYHSPQDDWQRVDADFFQKVYLSLRQILDYLEQQPPEWYQAAYRH